MIALLLAATLFEQGVTRLELGGYARTLAAVRSLRQAGLPRSDGGNSATVLRAEWKARLGEGATAELHQRGALQFGVGDLPLGSAGPGLGVSATPVRSLDLHTQFLDRATLRLDHDIDRLLVRIFTGAVDLTLGRQAIGWGTAMLFQATDLWATFSPFELDTSQKRGIDAVRALWSLGERAELEAIVADRGSLDDLSAGLRASFYREVADLWIAAAKSWNEAILLGGVAAETGAFKLRADAALPFDLDDRALELPRATVGIDWFRSDLVLSVEGHFNGAGAPGARSYLAHLFSSPEFARRETYLFGRWYAGAAAQWHPWEPLALGATVLANLRDPSATVSLAAVYSVWQSVQLTLGGFRGLGALGRFGSNPTFPSEFGAYGSLAYLELAAFF